MLVELAHVCRHLVQARVFLAVEHQLHTRLHVLLVAGLQGALIDAAYLRGHLLDAGVGLAGDGDGGLVLAHGRLASRCLSTV